jgi:chemotaxis protein CheX
MEARLVNPFLQGAQETLATICGAKPSLGSVFVKKLPYTADDVSIQIDIIGDMIGKVIYTMHTPAACYVASKMMAGQPVSALDDISKSALAELGNMISGRVATILAGGDKFVDITPPRFEVQATSASFVFPQQSMKLICIPLNLSEGLVFEMDLFIGEASQ